MSVVINTLLSSASTFGGFTDFLLGHKAYFNTEREITYPACWIQLLEFKTHVSGSTSFENTYFIHGYVCDQCGIDKPVTEIQSTIEALRPKFEKFLSYLIDRSIEVPRDLMSRQAIHMYDDQTVGYEFSLSIRIEETHTYC